MANFDRNRNRGRRPETRRAPVGKTGPGARKGRGLLSFFFSFYGSISRELFTGASVALVAISIALSIALPLLPRMPYVGAAFGIIQLVLTLSVISLGYKRSHALGMSGFYSIVGTSLFMPFFSLFRPERDFANDGAYARRFERFRKIGAFFTKSPARLLVYLTAAYGVSIFSAVYDGGNFAVGGMSVALMAMYAFNVIQAFVANMRWLRRLYVPVVKVLSFAAYNVVVAGITMIAYQTYLLIQIMRGMGAGS